MAWHAIDPAVPGEVIAAAWFNEQVGDNLSALRAGGLAIPGMAAQHFIYAASATQLASTAIAGGHVPRYNGAGYWENFRVVGTQELYIPAGAFRPRVYGSAGCGWHDVMTNVTGGEVLVLPFANAAPGDAAATFTLPKAWIEGTPVGVAVYWTHGLQTGSYEGAVTRWQVFLAAAVPGTALGAFGGGLELTGQASGPQGYVSIMGGPSSLCAVGGQSAPGPFIMQTIVRRTPGTGPDVWGALTHFVGLKLFVQTDQNTDD